MRADDGRSEVSHDPPAETGPAPFPSRFRLLCVATDEPCWIGLTLQLDAAECLEPRFSWVSTPGEALALLRDESFDCILLVDDQAGGAFDPLSLLEALRAAGYDDPVILIAGRLEDGRWAEACRHNSDVLITADAWNSRALLPTIRRALARIELSRENHRLQVAQHRRLVRERDEAEHLLSQQRQILQELQSLTAGPDATASAANVPNDSQPAAAAPLPVKIPAGLDDYYHELLRTYVIMGSGSLGSEIVRLAELIALAGLSPREALQLHLERVESLVRGLGNRSTRHVMARADLLALELMVHLGECYQKQTLSGS